MPAFVRLAVNVPSAAGVFDYAVPATLDGRLEVGSLVYAPFGRQTIQGVVLRFVDRPAAPEVKEIGELVDPAPVLTRAQVALAEALSAVTLSPPAALVSLFLPPGLNQQVDTLYELRPATKPPTEVRAATIEGRLLRFLQSHGPSRGRQLDRALPGVEWRPVARSLVRRGLLASRSILAPPSVRPKFVRTAQLAVAPQRAEQAMQDLGRAPAAPRRQKALRFLIEHPEPINVSWVYAESGCNLADLQALAERGLVWLRETEIFRDPLRRVQEAVRSETPKTLTSEQEAALTQIVRALEAPSEHPPLLLQGVTGSGKTELYLQAAQEALQRGRQAIVLVPEIALTPQTVQRFLRRFPGRVGLMHSGLSDGERYDTWRRARAGSLQIIIGPRSALFAPLPHPGLIVVDECHDASYYQSTPPFYHAVTAAQMYARLCGAVCVLGSATPSVVQQYQAQVGESIRLELKQRIASQPAADSAQGLDLPPVYVVDMRQELKAGHRHVFSRRLIEALETTLQRGEQAILFLNRRGTATYVFCRHCGYALRCPRCETPLTCHQKEYKVGVDEPRAEASPTPGLICHHCGYQRQLPKRCPECSRPDIRAYGLGSEKVEAEVQRLFPQARTLRWDWDTTRQKGAHEIILAHFVAGRADVLVGTQMLAKGLDLPRVTLVGIVLADMGLFLPDPFAAERVFQVLTQVAGRAGRSPRGGQVILQTFAPQHYVIQAAAQHDVDSFYRFELEQRLRLGYPPFARLVRLEFRHHDALRAEEAATALAAKLRNQIEIQQEKHLTMIGPAPCFFQKIRNEYRWQIILRGADPTLFLQYQPLTKGWRVEVDPISLL